MIDMQSFERLVSDQARADALFRLPNKLVDAGHFAANRPSRDQAEHPGNADLVVRSMSVLIGQAEDVERRRGRLGVPHRLNGGDLHLLIFAGRVTAFVAKNDDR
jgi:hypothetical protein